MEFKFNLRWKLAFVKVAIVVFGVQINFTEIGTMPISNFSGYHTDTYYIEAKVMRPAHSPARSPWSSSDRFHQTSSEEDAGRERILFKNNYGLQWKSGFGNQRRSSVGSIVFPTNEPQQQPKYSHRPMSTRMGNTQHHSGWNKPEVVKVTKNEPISNPTTAYPFVFQDSDKTTVPSRKIIKNDESDEDIEAIFGDFYNWIETSSKPSSSVFGTPERIYDKPRKFAPLGDEDIATKTNYVDGDSTVDEESLDGLDVTEQSLLNALNDKSCPEGFKRVPSGECKPKIRV